MHTTQRAKAREELRTLTSHIDANGLPFTPAAIDVLLDVLHAVDEADTMWDGAGSPPAAFYADAAIKYLDLGYPADRGL